MKYNLVKNRKRLKAMAPKYYDFGIMLGSLCLCLLAFDLNLETFCNVNGWVFLSELVYGFAWFVDYVIYCIIVKKKTGKLHDPLKDDENESKNQVQ